MGNNKPGLVATIINPLDDEGNDGFLCVAVDNGAVILAILEDDDDDQDNEEKVHTIARVTVDIRDILSTINFLDSADRAPSYEELREEERQSREGVKEGLSSLNTEQLNVLH